MTPREKILRDALDKIKPFRRGSMQYGSVPTIQARIAIDAIKQADEIKDGPREEDEIILSGAEDNFKKVSKSLDEITRTSYVACILILQRYIRGQN